MAENPKWPPKWPPNGKKAVISEPDGLHT